MIIGDITLANSENELPCLRAILARKQEFPSERAVLICGTHQEPAVREHSDYLEIKSLPQAVHWGVIAGLIHDDFLVPFLNDVGRNTEKCIIVSYRKEVLALSADVSQARRDRVQFMFWAVFRNPSLIGAQLLSDSSNAVNSSATNLPLSKAETLDVIRSVLEKKGGSLLASQLRPLLANERPDIFTVVRTSQSANLISNITELAEREGLIRTEDWKGTKREKIILIKRDTPLVHKDKEEHPQVVVIADKKTEIRDRSQQFFDILWDANFGPYATIRSKLYDVIQALVLERKFPPTILLRKAVYEVRGTEVSRKIVWENVFKFLYNLFSRRPVFHAEQGGECKLLSPENIEHIEHVVVGLSDQWRDELDACILEVLIEKDGRVRNSELADMAVVLFNIRAEEGQFPVARLIARLARARRIAADSKGYYFSVNK